LTFNQFGRLFKSRIKLKKWNIYMAIRGCWGDTGCGGRQVSGCKYLKGRTECRFVGVCACNYLKDDAVINYATFSFHSNVSFFIAFQRAWHTDIFIKETAERVEKVRRESEERAAQAQTPGFCAAALLRDELWRILTCQFAARICIFSTDSSRGEKSTSRRCCLQDFRRRFIIKSQ